MSRLAGKKALVTGAAQGLGFAIARRLAMEGAEVLLTDRQEEAVAAAAEAIERDLGLGRVHAIGHDVTSEVAWRRAIAAAADLMGGLSVLVNNAGAVMAGTVEELSLADWNAGMGVNATGPFLGCKEALPLLRQAQPASIVNISSISAMVAGHNLASYNASKAAVWMLTKSVALHCARSGWNIRCNSVHPTFVRTAILDDLVGHRDPAVVLPKLARQVPLGFLGEPDDVAHAVVYLASDESRFMTGAELKLDGGISAM